MDIDMKIDKKLVVEIESLYDCLVHSDNKWVNLHQDFILVALSLILNSSFNQGISSLRKKYKVPSSWYETSLFSSEKEKEWLEWLDDHFTNGKYSVPIESSEEISQICSKCGVDPLKYGYFVMRYLYLSDVRIDEDVLSYQENYDQLKYKCGVELIQEGESVSIEGPRAYIRFYKDTTINQLIEFIQEEKQSIRAIQRNLCNEGALYPHQKIYGIFKRDLCIYLLRLLGHKSARIIYKIQQDKLLSGEEAILSGGTVNQIVKDVKSKVHKATLCSFKV